MEIEQLDHHHSRLIKLQILKQLTMFLVSSMEVQMVILVVVQVLHLELSEQLQTYLQLTS